MSFEIEYLKKKHPELASNIPVINTLKQMTKIAEQEIVAPEPFKTVLKYWHQLKIIGFGAIFTQESFIATKNCWEDINKIFHEFDDTNFLESYCLLDFPGYKGKSFAENFSEECFNSDELLDLGRFSLDMAKSSLNLYQVILANKKVIKLKEFFTGSVFEVIKTIDIANPGEIFLVRLIPLDNKYMMFSDPKVFPKDKKTELENMVQDKAFMFYYSYKSEGIIKEYCPEKLHFKLSGPYWMSLVTEDLSIDILDPDYWEKYLQI